MKRMATCALGIALLVAPFAACFAAGAADLVQVYRDAVTHDAQYAGARAQLDAGRERLAQGRAGLLPNVGFTANTTWNEMDIKEPFSSKRNFNANAYTVQLTQPVFRWQNWISYEQAKLQVVQAEVQFASAMQDLVLRVTQAYFDVLLAQDSLVVAQAQKSAIDRQLEQAKRNFEVGTATIVDTHEAQARYDLAVAQEIAAQNELRVSHEALRQIIGNVPEALRPLKQTVQLQPPQPNDMQEWVAAAKQTSYNVQLQQAALEIATREVQRIRAGHYPTLDLAASRSYSKQGAVATSAAAVASELTTDAIGLQLAIPIYQGGAVSSSEREAAALREKALQDLESTRRTAAQSARLAYLGVTSGMAQIRALEQALVSSQSALESNKLGYDVGVRINIDVLNAQQQVYSTRRDLAKARYDTLLSQLRLKSAAGALGEEDVQAINALLNDSSASAVSSVLEPVAEPRPH